LPLNPVILFGVALLVPLILYALGKGLEWKGPQDPEAEEPYACGEEYPVIHMQLNQGRFFFYLAAYLAFDVGMFLIALAYQALIHAAVLIMLAVVLFAAPLAYLAYAFSRVRD